MHAYAALNIRVNPLFFFQLNVKPHRFTLALAGAFIARFHYARPAAGDYGKTVFGQQAAEFLGFLVPRVGRLKAGRAEKCYRFFKVKQKYYRVNLLNLASAGIFHRLFTACKHCGLFYIYN